MHPTIENAIIVTGVERETVPSDRLFTEKGKPVSLGAVPWEKAAEIKKIGERPWGMPKLLKPVKVK